MYTSIVIRNASFYPRRSSTLFVTADSCLHLLLRSNECLLIQWFNAKFVYMYMTCILSTNWRFNNNKKCSVTCTNGLWPLTFDLELWPWPLTLTFDHWPWPLTIDLWPWTLVLTSLSIDLCCVSLSLDICLQAVNKLSDSCQQTSSLYL